MYQWRRLRRSARSWTVDLYDELTMPPELRKAHHQNDMAVMQAYGFTKGSEAYKSEAACVAELMKLYQKKVEEIEKR